MTGYTILIHPAEEGGFWVEVPTLPGCFSQGESIEETMKNVREAIELHIECLKEENQPIPVENDLIISRIHLNPIQA